MTTLGAVPDWWLLELPYEAPPLSLNREMHWAKKREWERQIMNDTLLLARQQKLPKGLARVHIVLHWQPSTRKTRDSDNPTPTLKKCIDGLVKYGLCEDDDHTRVSSECVIDPVVPRRGQTWLAITERQA